METVLQSIAEHPLPLLDFVLVSIVVYYGLLLLRGVRNHALLQLLSIMIIGYLVCQYFRLFTLGFVIERMLLFGPILFVVVFAPELRRFFGSLGRTSRFWRDFVPGSRDERIADSRTLSAVCDAALELSRQRTGALVVIQLDDATEQHVVTGTQLDAVISTPLLLSLFNKHNPLHDGAVVISDDRVVQAGCFLPMSESTHLHATLGTRHRAAVGLSERCDAVVVVVSEERRTFGIAHQGRLAWDLAHSQFCEQLAALVLPNETLVTRPMRAGLG